MSLQVWLPLNGNLTNQGVANVTVTNSGATVDNTGKIGPCYSFDGSDDRIIVDGVSLGNVWSYSIWVYSPVSTRSWEGIVILNTNGGDSDMQLGMYTNPNSKVIQNTANGQYNSSISMTYGQWNHFCGTFDGSNLLTYLNGVLVNTKAITNSLLSRTKLTLGARRRGDSSFDCFFNGKLNDFRIYDTVLSAKEVAELAKGLVLHYPLNDTYIESTTNLCSTSAGGWNNSGTCTRKDNDTTITGKPTPGNVYSLTATSDGSMAISMGTTPSNHPSKTLVASVYCWLDGTQDSQTVYLRSQKTDGSVGYLFYNGESNPTLWPKKQWIRLVSQPIATASDATTFYICTYVNKNTEVRAFNGWQIEEKSHVTDWVAPGTTRAASTTMFDTSGYKYNGTISGSLTCADDTPKYSNASIFSNSYISRGLLPITVPATLSIWIKFNTLGNQIAFVDSGTKLGLGIYSNHFLVNYGSSCNKTYAVSAITANTWHHYCVIKDTSSTVIFYIDGVVQTVTTDFADYWSETATICEVGGRGSGTLLSGSVSDVRVYATALTADQVKELYNTGASVTNNGTVMAYEFVEG